MFDNGRRVVVTGLGAVTPCGNTVDESWLNIKAGNSGIGLIQAFDTTGYSSRIGGEVRNFDPLDYIDKKDARRMDRFVHLAMAASVEAMRSFEGCDIDGENIATIIGSGIGGIITFETQHHNLIEKGPGKISPFYIPMMISDMASGLVSIRYGLKGPNYCTVSACASGGNAIATAFMLIKQGYSEAALTGGAEGTISPMALGGFCSMKALSTRNDDPSAASRPFDVDRDGFVMSEGAGLVLLEELSHARARGAEILAELSGVGMSGDAYHMTSPVPGGAGAVKAMKMALLDAGLEPDDIDYINAHGTSTLYNDRAESEAITGLFGTRDSLRVSSTKSSTGHLLGAAAGIEFIVSVKALLEQTIPPTANLDNIDPECPLNHVPRNAVEKELKYVISNSFGFGGHNVSLLLSKFEG
ncbi:MAG: beta-ketoacyl-ACP synthase II [Candidatus Krumholzibacteriota bacterium]|nr:beta-ketoacyl-ACP synthase II [Candidatus Krumholzibacteriota bacterium]